MFGLNAFAVEPYDNNVYILSDPLSKDALLIDAANNVDRILAELKGLSLSHILTTHGHPDHVQAAAAVRRATGALFTCHPGDAGMMPIAPDVEARDGDRFRFGAYELQAIHTPGHTPGSLCFLIEDRLFTGDTLFPGGPGNTSGPGASFPTIITSIRDRLFSLDGGIRVLPGHGKPTTIGDERGQLDAWVKRGW
ncbi:MAG TPA: MBL fold metallo-hydrolase [Candidatus Dormibacteraeota bacterium]|nr:MBL fold metallo-hydrolase [Candidatus Dormibacteraeota bacterium]